MKNHRNVARPAALAIFLILAFTATTLLACSSSAEQVSPPKEAPTTPSSPVVQGQKVFAVNCVACHGINGQGQENWHIRKADGTLPAPPLNGDGHTWHHGDGLLYRIVREGGAELAVPGFKSAMPAFAEVLSHQEIIAVLNYLKSLWEGKMSRGLFITESQAFASEHDPFPPVEPPQ